MRVRPKRLANKLKRYKVRRKFVADWDSSRIDPYNGRSDFVGVMLHHTAGVDSLRYICYTNPYRPVRAAHFLVQRDGTVAVCSGVGAYHAGKGGPWVFQGKRKDIRISADQGNSRFYGIEIESKGTSRKIDGSLEGMTVEQVVETAILTAALLNAMRRGWRSLPVSRVIRHRDWTSRKIDVQQDLEWWHAVIGIARRNRKNRKMAEQLIRQFVEEHPKGRI
jgi:N-acetyl-anhydromuramyl-L-alanine amidase AmpD